jgi:hypothetical protein
MDERIFSLTSMAITHLVVDDYVLARQALTSNPCSNVVFMWLRSENIRRSSLSNIPTPPNFGELVNISALAACTSKVDSNDRALLKFDILTARTLRMFIENIFSTSRLQKLRYALQCKSCTLEHRAIVGVSASFLTNIWTTITSTFFILPWMLK